MDGWLRREGAVRASSGRFHPGSITGKPREHRNEEWHERGTMKRALPNHAAPALIVLGGLLAISLPDASTHAVGQELESRFGQELETRFKQELTALWREFGFPGATAAFILPDGTVGRAATGLADLESEAPMKPGSRMLAASIGKTFVAAAVLAAVEDGEIGIQDPVSRWLGERPWFNRLPNHSTLTVSQLLRHTGGVPDHVYSGAFAEAWQQTKDQEEIPFSPEDLVSFVLDEPPLFPAGEGWAYTDTGYVLLGLILEKATGRNLYDVVMDRFLVPLRLGLTTPSDRRILPGLAAGYTDPDNPFGLPPRTTVAPGIMAWNPGVEWAGGGFVSNPGDLVVWARKLYEREALKGEYLTELLKGAPVEPENDNVRYGAGVAIYESGPLGPVWGHAGRIPGYVSSMRYYPDHGIAVAFQVNTDVESGGRLVSEMERRLAALVVESDRSR